MKIFVIDDDPIHQKISEIKWRKVGMEDEVIPFLEADAALLFLRENQHIPELMPDLILLDLNMPVMDGWDFLDEFGNLPQAVHQRVRIYIVTSSVDLRDQAKATRYPFVSGYVTKPLNDADLSRLRLS